MKGKLFEIYPNFLHIILTHYFKIFKSTKLHALNRQYLLQETMSRFILFREINFKSIILRWNEIQIKTSVYKQKNIFFNLF